MSSAINLFYHPFKNSSLGFFLADHESYNLSGSTLESIDLYYQPVESPAMAIALSVIKFLMTIFQEYTIFVVLKKLKKCNSLFNDLATLPLYVGSVYLPVWLVFSTLTDSLNPLHALIGRWFCTVGWMFSKFTYNLVLWNSLILAAMRYVLILHSDPRQYKREMLRRLFIFLSVFIPVVLTIWTALEGSDLSVFSFINKCNGVHHNIFLHKTPSLPVQKSTFGDIKTSETQHNLGEFVNVMKDILRWTRYVLTATIGFNIVEGILYYKILHHMNR